MAMMRARLLIVLLLLLPTSAAFSIEWTAHRDIEYTPTADDAQRLDIYTPTTPQPEPRPVLIYVHGGGWYTGDKSKIQLKADWSLEQGFIFVSINYRLLPAARHPSNSQDVATAISWIRHHVGDYGGDPQSLFLIGHSAGAHLVALVATDERLLAAHELALDTIRGVIAIDTESYDVEARLRSLPAADRRLHLAVFGGHPVTWRDASPRVHATAGKQTPPFLLLVAGNSSTSEQARSFAAALERAGGIAHIEAFPEETHGSINGRLGREDHPPTAAVAQFLVELTAGDPIGSNTLRR